nr:hypothetical protein B456_009G375300 [Gossypium raimondii]
MWLNSSGLLLCLPPIPATTWSGRMDFDHVFIHSSFFPLNLRLLLRYCGAQTRVRGLLAIAPERYCYCCCS